MHWSGAARFVGIATISAVALLASATARADGFAADRFQPAPAGSDWFAQDSLRFREQPLSLGLELGWAHDPLVSRSAFAGDLKRAILRNQTTAGLGASAVLFERLRFDAQVPFLSLQSGQGSGVAGGLPKPSAAAFGDARLAADVLLLDTGALRGAAGLAVFLPTGSRGAYSSDGRVRVSPRVAFAGDAARWSWAAQVGIDANRDETVGAPVRTRLSGGASAGYCSPGRALCFGPELDGSAVLFQGARFHQAASAPLEGLLGVHVRFLADWQWALGLGTALDSGIGAAVPRALASLQWSPRAQTPSSPARAALGMPVAPAASPTPAASPAPAPSPTPAAPPTPAAAPSPTPAASPSPPPAIEPPAVAPPPAYPAPRPDDDALPLPPLVYSLPDNLALPSAPLPLPALAPLVNQRLVTDQRIDFEGETAALTRESEKPLQQLRIELAAHPEYRRVEIGGHTAYPGGDELNLRLSRERAEAVRAWLIAHGIDAGRLSAVGYGSTRPLFVGATAVNIRKNRRIEVQVLEVKP